MKLKAIALALFVAGAGASYALAGNGHGQDGTTGSTSSTEHHGNGNSQTCRPQVAFVLNGTFVSAAADGSSLTMNVTHANHHAKALGNPATVMVGPDTTVRENGKAVKVTDLKVGERLNVMARGCKNPAAGAAPTLVAKRVVAHPASSGGDEAGTTTDSTTEHD
jgi:hypothetical protein